MANGPPLFQVFPKRYSRLCRGHDENKPVALVLSWYGVGLLYLPVLRTNAGNITNKYGVEDFWSLEPGDGLWGDSF